MYRNLILAGAGSCIGGIFRYLVQTSVQHRISSPFPLGTFIVNITGCFAIGLVYGLVAKGELLSPETRVFLASGICGGYTTFSSFALENFALMGNREWWYFSLYISSSIILGLAATFLGALSVRLVWG